MTTNKEDLFKKIVIKNEQLKKMEQKVTGTTDQ